MNIYIRKKLKNNMNAEKLLNQNSEFLNAQNIYYSNLTNKNQQKFQVKEPETKSKNLEPHDNMKRLKNRQLKMNENKSNLLLESENFKINEKRQIINNNLSEKEDIKSLTEINTKKTIRFFNKDKEKIIENLPKKKNNSIYNIESIIENKKENIEDMGY